MNRILRSPRKTLKYLIVGLTLFGVLAVILEFPSGIAHRFLYTRQMSRNIDNPYEYFDRTLQINRYHRGYRLAAAQVLENIRKSEGADALDHYLQLFRSVYKEQTISDFTINHAGLKGPEILPKRGDTRRRALILGDSNTFGPGIDQLGYPRVLEHYLNTGDSLSYEVINGGFSGYSIFKMNQILDELLSLEPDYVIVLLGWNGSIIRGDPARNEFLYFHSNLYRLAYHAALKLRRRTSPYYRLDRKVLDTYGRVPFTYDLRALDRMLDRITEQVDRNRVFIMTVPCRFTISHIPEAAAISRCQPPDFTDNLAAYAVLTGRFNDLIRDFARERRIHLVDLAAFAEQHFQPRDQYFEDAIHLKPDAHLKTALLLYDALSNRADAP